MPSHRTARTGWNRCSCTALSAPACKPLAEPQVMRKRTRHGSRSVCLLHYRCACRAKHIRGGMWLGPCGLLRARCCRAANHYKTKEHRASCFFVLSARSFKTLFCLLSPDPLHCCVYVTLCFHADSRCRRFIRVFTPSAYCTLFSIEACSAAKQKSLQNKNSCECKRSRLALPFGALRKRDANTLRVQGSL